MNASVASKVTLLVAIGALALSVAIAVSALVPLAQLAEERDTAVAALTVAEANAQAAGAGRDACAEAADLWRLSAVAFATQLAAGTTDISDGNDHANAAEAAGCTTP